MVCSTLNLKIPNILKELLFLDKLVANQPIPNLLNSVFIAGHPMDVKYPNQSDTAPAKKAKYHNYSKFSIQLTESEKD